MPRSPRPRRAHVAAHHSGTDRLWEVARAPRGRRLRQHPGRRAARHAGPHRAAWCGRSSPSPRTQVSTLYIRATPDGGRHPAPSTRSSPASHGDALYFSQCRIPFDRDGRGDRRATKHIGLYAYRAPRARGLPRLPPSTLERTEQLEQLRFLENGIAIRVLETDRADDRRGHRGGPPGRRGPVARPRGRVSTARPHPRLDHGRPDHGQRRPPRHPGHRPADPRRPRPLARAGGLLSLRLLHRPGAHVAARRHGWPTGGASWRHARARDRPSSRRACYAAAGTGALRPSRSSSSCSSSPASATEC